MIRILVGLLIILIGILVDTEVGLHALLKIIPGHVSVRTISGSLLHGWKMQGLVYDNQDLHLTIEAAQVDWKPIALLDHTLMIEKISIDGVTLRLPQIESSESSSGPLPLLSIPLSIILKKADIHHLNIQHYTINDVELAADVIHNTLTIHQFTIKTPDVHSEGTGYINLENWSSLSVDHQLIFLSHPDIPIVSHLSGNDRELSLAVQSTSWLTLHLHLANYLALPENIRLNADWTIDATQTAFPELNNIDGQLLLSGKASGTVGKPTLSTKLSAKHITYEGYTIEELISHLDISLTAPQNIDFRLTGKHINVDGNMINSVNASVIGSLPSHHIHTAITALGHQSYTLTALGHFSDQSVYSLREGKLGISPLNLVLSPINLDIKGTDYHATFHHDHETLTIDGDLHHANMNSDAFTFINLKEYQIKAAPHLILAHEGEATDIKGTVNILNATLAPTDFSNTVTLPDDVIYVDNEGKPLNPKKAPPQIVIDVALGIQQLRVHYQGLTARISGQTTLNKSLTGMLNAYGQLGIQEGTYKSYGQELTIDKASTITFNGLLDDPLLNISASKHISVSPDILVLPSYQPYLIAGVQITGTANQPNIHLFSVPSGISQQDILSYLVFGYPQSQLTNSQAGALWNALNVMDTGYGHYSLSSLQQDIQKEFGLSEFGLGNTSEYNAETQQYESGSAFVLGKRITQDLTASYHIGIMAPVNVLYLKYQLSPRWSLQSDSSALGNGGDVFYTIRKD